MDDLVGRREEATGMRVAEEDDSARTDARPERAAKRRSACSPVQFLASIKK